MVKILENQLIDLDIMPGAKPADLLAKASAIEQQNPQKAEALRALAEQKAKVLKNEMERKTAGMPLGGSAAAPEEEVPQQGGFVGGVKGVGMGLVNTVGALGKGVGDTLGNTVYGLGKGLVDTGTGVAGGLTQTGKSAVGAGGHAQQAESGGPTVGAFEPAETVDKQLGAFDESSKDTAEAAKKGPRKIEVRTGQVENDLPDEPKLEREATDDPSLDKFTGVKLVDNES